MYPLMADQKKDKRIECTCAECGALNKRKCIIAEKHPELIRRAVDIYKNDDFVKWAVGAHSQLLGRGGSRWPRIRHIAGFCKAGGITKAGIGVCMGFLEEAKHVKGYLSEQGIDAVVVCCGIGGLKLEDMGISRDVGYDYTSCNPVSQINILNGAETGINIMMGLCVGHDMIFNRLSEAPVTALFVKEHISGHSPYSTIREMIKGDATE